MTVKNIIIINEMVVFEPDKNRLTALKDYPERNITLHTPVSACLLLLLQHNHQPVTQKYLFSEVWEKNGAMVSTNAIYQSIALIRKGLRAVGLDEEIIFTLPKIGFKADANVKTLPFDEFIAARSAQKANTSPETITTAAIIKEKRLYSPFLRRYHLIPAAGGIIILLFIFYWYQQTRSFYTHYTNIGNIHGCQVYSSWSGKEKSTHIFNQFYARQDLTCPPGKTIYMTLNNTQSGTSILVCRAKIDSPDAKCKSLFFMEKYDD
ncbi:winged helix-turn-helix domain-containing protein [Citrobacter koseri]|uniref:winged helix-turn-helix domain-containing protein n=1 Tax=Citrobacter koseri TaxID=545 RepID=UPI0024B73ABC|nr:winged helix-turn-helix domain-containing protein [Citrobacter koseri]MDI9802633.1 winged helix-turn-helix domain-containing protein [Citrobacter koseri]